MTLDFTLKSSDSCYYIKFWSDNYCERFIKKISGPIDSLTYCSYDGACFDNSNIVEDIYRDSTINILGYRELIKLVIKPLYQIEKEFPYILKKHKDKLNPWLKQEAIKLRLWFV